VNRQLVLNVLDTAIDAIACTGNASSAIIDAMENLGPPHDSSDTLVEILALEQEEDLDYIQHERISDRRAYAEMRLARLIRVREKLCSTE